jgi:hypothetical protein
MLKPLALLKKLSTHLRLLKNDPEKFASNLLQFTDPEGFQRKLADVQKAPELHLSLSAALSQKPTLNVLQPVLSPAVMTGGPNTVINLAHAIARSSVPVRIVTSQATSEADLYWFWQHLSVLTGETVRPSWLTVASAGDAAHPLPIGSRDMFLATHWTTAQQVKRHLPHMDIKRCFYLIQDYEPGFYPWSSNYALALETYGLDHIGVFNERLLYDYFVAQKVGIYADPELADQGLVFEPAVDRAHFHPPNEARVQGKRRLLYYARPGNPRNMLGLGLEALRAAVGQTVFQHDNWEFLAIGGSNSLPPIPLGHGAVLQPAPWFNYSAYGNLLRTSDVLLCPMLSPHTSYPVLEMAASGGVVVTNSFGTKTATRLKAISANIIAAPPTEEGLAQALVEAAVRLRHGVDRQTPLHLPVNWNVALAETARNIAAIFRQAVEEVAV